MALDDTCCSCDSPISTFYFVAIICRCTRYGRWCTWRRRVWCWRTS